jgi:hypothetical protein
MKGSNLKFFFLGAALVATGLWAMAVTIPNNFSAGEVLSAARINANFAALNTAVDALEARPTPPTVTVAPADDRFAVMYVNSGGIRRLLIRGDGSIREQSDPAVTLTKLSTGVYCINAPGALEGAVGSLQNQGGGGIGTIRVSQGIAGPCNAVTGTTITVETFRLSVSP